MSCSSVGRAGGRDGGADAAGGVGLPRHAGGELLRAIAGEHQVAVAVHVARDHRATHRRRRPCRPRGRSLAGPTQAIVPPSITTAASSTRPEQPGGVAVVVGAGAARGRVVGDQLADAGDQDRSRVPHLPDRLREARPDLLAITLPEDDPPVDHGLGDVGGDRRRRRRCARRRRCRRCAGWRVSRVTRSARRPTAIAPASSQPRLACPVAGRCPHQLGRLPVAALLADQPFVELDGAHLLEEVDDGVAVGAEGQPRAGVGERRLGPTPSPRSRSVVGQKDTNARAAPSSAMSSSVRCVAWTAEVSGPRRPWSARSRVGVTPYAARQPSFSATCSERWTWSGRPACPLGERSEGGGRVRGERPDGVEGARDQRRLACSASVGDPVDPGVDRPVVVPHLRTLGRSTEPAGEVERCRAA